MSLNTGKILKINITFSGKENILEEIQKYLSRRLNTDGKIPEKAIKPFIVLTPNPEQIVYAQSSDRFAKILNWADVTLPDGIGLVWADRVSGRTHHKTTGAVLRKRIPGVEFMEDLVKESADQGYRIGLIGGLAGLAVKTLECLLSQYPKLSGWAERGPVLTASTVVAPSTVKDMAKKIMQTKTRMVFVGMGAPKQEVFIEALAQALVQSKYSLPVMFMAVGGSFDIITGRLRRAPLFIRSIGFEWAWRLFQEPWRWRRQLALLKFIVLVWKENNRTV